MNFSEDVLGGLWPHGDDKIPGLIEGIAASADAVFAKYEITTDLVVAHLMAQFSHECGAGLEMTENLNYSAQGLMNTWPRRFDAEKAARFAHRPQLIANEVYNGRMGNAPGSDDGWNFRGRGLSQCTGREGYQKLADKTGLDIIGNPDLVSQPTTALECGVADFILCGCLPFAEQDDIMNVTLHLNGGHIGEAEREAWLAKWKDALSV
jgi:putative chitinase